MYFCAFHISAVTIPYNYIVYDRPCNLSELLGQDLAHYHQSSRNSFSYKHKSDSHSNVIYSLLPMRRRSKQWPLSREGCSTVSWNVPTQSREGFCVYMDERAPRGVTSATWTATSARQASHSYRSARRHALRHGLKYRVKVLHCSLLLLKSRSVRLNLINTEYQSREASVSAGLAHLEASLCGAALPDSAREKEK